MTQLVDVVVIEILMNSCEKCNHGEGEHRDDICHGDIGCTCMKFEEPVIAPLNIVSKTSDESIIYSRTEIPLPMFITTHDNWGGKGWEYQKKWGKTQSEMVEFLYFRCKLNEDVIRRFLRCKHSSVRGRLSEINKSRRIIVSV